MQDVGKYRRTEWEIIHALPSKCHEWVIRYPSTLSTIQDLEVLVHRGLRACGVFPPQTGMWSCGSCGPKKGLYVRVLKSFKPQCVILWFNQSINQSNTFATPVTDEHWRRTPNKAMASESGGIRGIDPPQFKIWGDNPPTFQAKLRLHTQLLLLPELCKRQSVTNIGELKYQLVDLGLSVYMFSEVKTLLKFFYVIPESSATAERSFSVMRRVKN